MSQVLVARDSLNKCVRFSRGAVLLFGIACDPLLAFAQPDLGQEGRGWKGSPEHAGTCYIKYLMDSVLWLDRCRVFVGGFHA